jgi:dipeptidyl aminopeptidase/acylaminoacyl peptidase
VGEPSGSREPGDLYTVDANGTHLVDLTARKKSLSPGEPRLIARYPSWSPDGKEIAFETYYGEFPSTVEIPSSGGAIKLLFTRANMPAWSPNGKLFAYVISGGGALDQILTSTATGGGTTTLTGSADNFEPAWSPDGKRLVFVRSNQITVMNANGSGLRQVTRRNPAVFVENPSW